MTEVVEVTFPENENCPDCGCSLFRPGPRAGINQNIECAQCLSRFNVARLEPGLPIIWSQRIPSEKDGGGEWREDMFPRVLQ